MHQMNNIRLFRSAPLACNLFDTNTPKHANASFSTGGIQPQRYQHLCISFLGPHDQGGFFVVGGPRVGATRTTRVAGQFPGRVFETCLCVCVCACVRACTCVHVCREHALPQPGLFKKYFSCMFLPPPYPPPPPGLELGPADPQLHAGGS